MTRSSRSSRASAVNNDGRRKVGYLAPSVDGHADVVKEALAVAGLSARDMQLFEAHGTGTSVGDPIEVAALTEAFRASTPDIGYCRIVSTKPNIGHLDTAAGVASLIKVMQAMRHRMLPPLANHTAPSPLLDLERSPFTISTTADPWPGDRPRRAGISSLGVGGTNAHVIVEEAPAQDPSPAATSLSRSSRCRASTPVALNDNAARLADFLEADPDTNIADVAHTLATGRRAHRHRRVVAAADAANAVEALRTTTATGSPPPWRPRIRSAWRSCSPAVARSTTAWRPVSTIASASSTRSCATASSASRPGRASISRRCSRPTPSLMHCAGRQYPCRRCS